MRILVRLVKRGDSPYLDEVGNEVVNFNICWKIYMVVAAFSILALVGFLLLPLDALAWLILRDQCQQWQIPPLPADDPSDQVRHDP